MTSFKDFLILKKNTYYNINIKNSIINESLFDDDFMFCIECFDIIMYNNNTTIYLDKTEFTYSDCIKMTNQLEQMKEQLIQIQKELDFKILLHEKVKIQKELDFKILLNQQKKEIEQLNTELYKTNILLQQEKICHWLTKKLCILPKI